MSWIATCIRPYWSVTAVEAVQGSCKPPSPTTSMKLDELDPSCWLDICGALADPRPTKEGTELCGTWLFSEEATGT